MRPRIKELYKIDIGQAVKEIEYMIEVKRQLVYSTSRINKCTFREAKRIIKNDTLNVKLKLYGNDPYVKPIINQ